VIFITCDSSYLKYYVCVFRDRSYDVEAILDWFQFVAFPTRPLCHTAEALDIAIKMESVGMNAVITELSAQRRIDRQKLREWDPAELCKRCADDFKNRSSALHAGMSSRASCSPEKRRWKLLVAHPKIRQSSCTTEVDDTSACRVG
jgi:hypothetical protein